MQNFLDDRFTPENVLLARAVLRYAFDRTDASQRKGHAIQLLGESDAGKSVLMQVIKECKSSLVADGHDFTNMKDKFWLSTLIGRGQDVVIGDDVSTIPEAQSFYQLISNKRKELEFKNGRDKKEIARNVLVIFGGTAVDYPSDSRQPDGL